MDLILMQSVEVSPEELARLARVAESSCPSCGGAMTVGADEHAGVCTACIDAAYEQYELAQLLGDEDGPGEEDGPWAAGWESRRGDEVIEIKDARDPVTRDRERLDMECVSDPNLPALLRRQAD